MHSSDGVFYSQVGMRASAGGLRRRAGSPGFVRSARDGWVGVHVSPSPVDPSWAVGGARRIVVKRVEEVTAQVVTVAARGPHHGQR
jgi:hypothetical protein